MSKSKAKWERVGCHCPSCGSCDTWRETGEGDFYVGPTYWCLCCDGTGNMWVAHNLTKRDSFERKELEAVKKFAASVKQFYARPDPAAKL